MADPISHRAAFEKKGVTAVRLLAEQDDDVGRQARAWLAEIDDARLTRAEARAEEALSISRSARRDSRIANAIAITAIIISVITAIVL